MFKVFAALGEEQSLENQSTTYLTLVPQTCLCKRKQYNYKTSYSITSNLRLVKVGSKGWQGLDSVSLSASLER